MKTPPPNKIDYKAAYKDQLKMNKKLDAMCARYQKDRHTTLTMLHSFAAKGVFKNITKRQVKQFNKIILLLQKP